MTSLFANLVAFLIGVSNEAPPKMAALVLAKRLLLVGTRSSKRKKNIM